MDINNDESRMLMNKNDEIVRKLDALSRYEERYTKKESLDEQKQEAQEKINSIKAINYDNIVNHGIHTDISYSISKLETLIEELNESINLCIDEYTKISRAIKNLSNPIESKIMHKKFCEFKKWEDVAREIGYGTTQTYRIYC